MSTCGIDPGKQGGIAFLWLEDGVHRVHVQPLPQTKELVDVRRIRDLMAIYEPKEVVIEKQWVRPGQGVVSSGTTMKNYGALLGLTYGCLGIEASTVTPSAWQKVMLPGAAKGQTKPESLKVAQLLYPTVSLLRTPRCTKLHDGMSDALLIAHYWRYEHA